MRLLIDASSNLPRGNGTGIYCRETVNALAVHPEVSAITAVGGIPPDADVQHVEPGVSNWHRLINWSMLANRPDYRADAALFPNYFMPPGFSIPSVVTIHDISFYTHPQFYSKRFSSYYTYRIRHTLECAQAILTVSRATRVAIMQAFGVSEEKIHVIPAGPSLTAIAGESPDRGRPYFLYVGSIEPKKNILNLVAGFLNANLPAFDLILAGRPAVSRRYFHRVREVLRVSDRVNYVGFVTDEELAALYRGCRGVINLSHIEGFSFPIRDAFHFGKPSLISNDPALRELCGGHAVTVDGNNKSEIASGYRRLAAYSAGEQLQRRRQELDLSYNWSEFSDRLVDVIGRAAHTRRHVADPGSPGENPVREAIVRAVCYASLFRSPVYLPDLHRLLHRTRCIEEHVACEVARLEAEHPESVRIRNYSISFAEHGISPARVTASRKRNLTLKKSASRLLRLMRRIPWCKQMYFSGNSVHGSPVGNSDIDLFIVSRQNRVWLLFTAIRLLSVLTRKQNIICNNYMVDESAAGLTDDTDFYAAFELLHLEPVTRCDDLAYVLEKNRWVFEHFPNATISGDEVAETGGAGNGKGFFSVVNLILMGFWSRRWRRMGFRNLNGGLRWDAHRIKLHVEDHRPQIMARLEKALEGATHLVAARTFKQTA